MHQCRPVYQSIKDSSDGTVYRVLRADDIWENSTIIQDIFSLIYIGLQ